MFITRLRCLCGVAFFTFLVWSLYFLILIIWQLAKNMFTKNIANKKNIKLFGMSLKRWALLIGFGVA